MSAGRAHWMQVYPRPRGEYRPGSHCSQPSRGLPPPTRGIRKLARRQAYDYGSTPAHAGNTRQYLFRRLFPAVYPRPRGEYPRSRAGARPSGGLPPPTRGIPPPGRQRLRSSRSTPAHAGNTGGIGMRGTASGVYPRPRGEYICIPHGSTPSRGLPPPTRGIRLGFDICGLSYRSTPAHAGNTRSLVPPAVAPAVYPRPRGEYLAIILHRRAIRGLPPPTRGILRIPSHTPVDAGSTPAHAGNTGLRQGIQRKPEVYPRPRGEYLLEQSIMNAGEGLPPPTRGIPGRRAR